MLIFVYGTLKKGSWNNHILMEADFVSEITLKGYKLYDSGFPVACVSPDDYVKGELYSVSDEKTLNRLDRLEHNGYMYHREEYNGRIDLYEPPGENIQLYVGHDDYWTFKRMREIPKNKDGVYEYSKRL